VKAPSIVIEIDDTTPHERRLKTYSRNNLGVTSTWQGNKGIAEFGTIFQSLKDSDIDVLVWGHKYGLKGIYLDMAVKKIFGTGIAKDMGMYEQIDVPDIMNQLTYHMNLYTKTGEQASTPRIEYCTREAIKWGAVPVVRSSMSIVSGFDPYMAVMIDSNNISEVGKLLKSIHPAVRKKLWSNAFHWWKDRYDSKKMVRGIVDAFNS